MSTNLISNPSFEVGTAGWSATNSAIVAISTDQAYVGDYSLKVTAGASGDIVVYTSTGTSGFSVSASTQYAFQARVRSTVTRNAEIGYEWFTAAGAGLGSGSTGSSAITNSWTRRDSIFTSSATAAFGSLRVIIRSAVAGEVFYIDAAMVEQSGAVNTYFDGDTAGYAWNGPAHLSSSSTRNTYPPEPAGVNYLHLDVEVPTEGLPNLVQNPSGEKGSWGWVSPVANTGITGEPYNDSKKALLMYTNASQATYFTSEHMPVTAGKYVGARVDLLGIQASHNIKMRFEWYNTSKVLLSSSTQTGALSTVATHYVGAVVAPANTAYVKLRVDLYNGAGNPSVGGYVWLRNAMVAWADTSGGLGTTRTNLIKNPSVEGGLAYWNATYATAIVSSAQAAVGTNSIAASCNNTTGGYMTIRCENNVGVPDIAISAGRTYTFQIRTRPGSTARTVRIQINWYAGDKSYISMIKGPSVTQTAGAWTTHTFTATAPLNAWWVTPLVVIGSPANGETHYADAAMLLQATEAGDYFSGSTAASGTKTYAWTGTANASSSIETSGASYGFSEPTTWQNILGPTHDIKITRKELDVGLLTATVLDANLDPSVASFIKPGKKVRVQAEVDGVWESLFEGKMTNAHVTYRKPKEMGGSLEEKGNVRIEITAADGIAHMANQGESRGVATIANLPYILEGKGVPWSVNGSGNQVTSATIVSSNENASVVDQAAITRDSVLGYAWMARNGVFKAYDKVNMPSTPVATFSDASDNIPDWFSYTDIDVDFNTDQCINDVTVKWLRYTSAAGTQEVVYTGYRDQASIDQWGARSATFTIQGASESPSAIATYANSILAANATPVVRANRLVMPVRNERERNRAATLDLYDLVSVMYDTKVDSDYRVTGITHNIRPGFWNVEMEFGVDASVAAPTWTPSPPVGTITTNAWQYPTLLNSWVNYGSGHANARYRLCPDGTVEIQGLVKNGTVSTSSTGNIFVLPVGYRPDTQMIYAQPSNTGMLRVDIWADGSVRAMSTLAVGASTAFVAINITFTPVGAA